MDTIFMKSGNSKTTDPHRLLLNLTDKVNLKRSDRYVALSNLSIYYTWNEEFELPDGSYSTSDIQNYFEYILKKQGTVTDNPSIRIYVNKIENKSTFNIKRGYYLQPLTPGTMKPLTSTKNRITKNENGKNVHHLEITEVTLVHCNIVNNGYQQNSRVLYKFVPNKSFGQLLDILPKNFTFLKTLNSEFSYIEVWFTYQNSRPLDITLVIN